MSKVGEVLAAVIAVWLIVIFAASALLLWGIDTIAGTTFFSWRNVLIVMGILILMSVIYKGSD